MQTDLQRSDYLYQTLNEFILDAEGELAVALEKFSVKKLSQLSSEQYQESNHQMVLDLFTIEGNINNRTPIDLFIDNQPNLTAQDKQLLTKWYNSFVGLFVVEEINPENLQLKNWMTDKDYQLKIKNNHEQQQLTRIKPGEILLTRISPLDEDNWIFTGPFTLMGKLGKPKLAIAIGKFQQHYPNYRYGDAPELLQEAWLSVAWYHQQFVDYFGSSEITMSGRELADKLHDFQQQLATKRLETAGIDPSKSLQNLIEESGVSSAEMQQTVQAMGVDTQTTNQIMDNSLTSKMVTPKVELPRHILNAANVTTISHPHWGQVFLTDYLDFQQLLASFTSENWQKTPTTEKLVRDYLNKPEVNTQIWLDLASEYPHQLEQILQDVLEQPNFSLDSDLQPLLQQHNKPSQPELPEIASVPIHLHNLFEQALLLVNRKNKTKGKSKSKPKTGFQS